VTTPFAHLAPPAAEVLRWRARRNASRASRQGRGR
jgi:hypothetical protein